jgi:hypothetical protein
VTLIFSGGAALRLEVECLECELADLGPTWDAKARPRTRSIHPRVDGFRASVHPSPERGGSARRAPR